MPFEGGGGGGFVDDVVPDGLADALSPGAGAAVSLAPSRSWVSGPLGQGEGELPNGDPGEAAAPPPDEDDELDVAAASFAFQVHPFTSSQRLFDDRDEHEGGEPLQRSSEGVS